MTIHNKKPGGPFDKQMQFQKSSFMRGYFKIEKSDCFFKLNIATKISHF